jgi:hypothetical protein
MLVPLTNARPFSTAGAPFVRGLGRLLSPLSESAPSLAIGAVGFVAIGALLGLLYACCQTSAPIKGVVTVALYFGLMIWAVGGLVTRIADIGTLRSVAHTGMWLVLCLCFSSALGAVALRAQRRSTHPVVPID